MPATLASRIRVLATKRSNKNDPNDAHSIAIAALRARRLRMVEPANHAEVLRLLSKRNRDLGRQRARVICRLHSLCAELVPGGIAKEMYVSDAEALLEKVTPETPVQQMRYDLVLELLDDVRRLDTQTKESHRRIRMAVRASGTSVTEIYGVGPIHAATIIGYSGMGQDCRLLAGSDMDAGSRREVGPCDGVNNRGEWVMARRKSLRSQLYRAARLRLTEAVGRERPRPGRRWPPRQRGVGGTRGTLALA